MKIARCLVVLLPLLAGCASVTTLEKKGLKTADGREIVATVGVRNTDWKLLCCLPIASGNPDEPNTCSCRWFRDTVTVQNQLDMLERERQRLGAAQAVDVTTYEDEEDVFLLAFLRRKMHTSATLVK